MERLQGRGIYYANTPSKTLYKTKGVIDLSSGTRQHDATEDQAIGGRKAEPKEIEWK